MIDWVNYYGILLQHTISRDGVMIDNKKLLMVLGHEIWREDCASMNAHVVLSLAYGHNMRQNDSVFITIPTMRAK
jgi:hypothetical protein